MDWAEYRALADAPDRFTRHVLEQALALVGDDDELAGALREALNGPVLARPADMRADPRTEMLQLRLPRPLAMRLHARARLARAADRASGGRGLPGFVEVWRDHVAFVERAYPAAGADRSGMARRRALAVFCGYRSGNRTLYREAVESLARACVDARIDVIYGGGGGDGLMGVLADAVLAANGRITGVIPEMLVACGEAHAGLDDLVVVRDMHTRKAEMARRADAFVALPGGLGTLDELMEILTWRQLGLHDAPVGLLDVDGYFAGLLGFLDHAVAEGFLTRPHRERLVVAGSPVALLAALGLVDPDGRPHPPG